MNFSLSLKSSNIKVGPIPVSMSSKDTCPDACPLKAKGCYAGQGPMSWVWNQLSKGEMVRKGKTYKVGMEWKAFVNQIKALPAGQLWRHNQAGDLAGKNDKINRRMLGSLVQANTGKNGYTYTHKPVLDEQGKESGANRLAIHQANKEGFRINLSGNNLAHADKLKALGIGPVVTVLSSDFKEEKGMTPAGNRFIVCPAQTKGITCAQCKLCSKDRSVIVAFLAHGMAKNAVNTIANQ